MLFSDTESGPGDGHTTNNYFGSDANGPGKGMSCAAGGVHSAADCSTRSTCRWGVIGASFGLGFPILAGLVRWIQLGGDGAMGAFATDPLLWIILTAPVFLGLFAAVGGRQQDGLRALSETLELRVQARTGELAALNGHMALVLRSVGDALVTVDENMMFVGEPQAQATGWFGQLAEGKTLPSYLAPGNAKLSSAMEVAFEQIREDFLPLDLLLDQVPRRFVASNGRHYGIDVRPVAGGKGPRRFLVVLRDATADVASEVAAAEQKELQFVATRMLEDPQGFRAFRTESEHLLEQSIGEVDEKVLRHGVHTLKGNAAVYGFARLAQACQGLEDAWQERGRAVVTSVDAHELQTVFEASMHLVAPFLSEDDGDVVRVDRGELLALLREVQRSAPPETVASALREWSLEPVAPQLSRLAAHAEQLGKRLAKPLDIDWDAGAARVDLLRYAPFFLGIVHVVRNAVDHGIEPSDVRESRGKGVGKLSLRARSDTTHLVVTISDDGGGINWDRIGTKARGLGLPFETTADRYNALFADGVSTAERVSDISGRGVGLGALRAVCKELSIEMSIDTAIGKGTTFTFSLPRFVGEERRSMTPTRSRGQLSIRP